MTDFEIDYTHNAYSDGPRPTSKPAPAPVSADPAEPVRSASDGYMGPGVSPAGKARALADEKAAKAAGFNPRPPIYEIGRLVNDMGVSNVRASRQEFENKAFTVEACENLIDVVAKERRTDRVVALTDLTMNPDGCLTRGGPSMPLSKRALSGLCGFATPGGGHYLAECPPELRAENVNHWLSEAKRPDKRAHGKALTEWKARYKRGPKPAMTYVDKEVTLRTRINRSTYAPEIWSVVGPKYAAHDIDQIAKQILTSEAIPADARADITYDGYQARINILFHTDIQPENAVAGEIFKAGICVKTADDGSGSIKISAEIWRNLCLNLIIIDHDRELVTRRRHVGDQSVIAADVEKGIAHAMSKVGYFAKSWGAATLENVLDKYGTQDVDAVMRGLVFNKVVHVPNVKPADMFGRLMRAWQQEPGYSKTAIVNAVTRAAHTEEWNRWGDIEDLERTGGELLFAPVWNVEVPADQIESLGY